MATITQQAVALVALSAIAITAAIGCADLAIPQSPDAPVHISGKKHHRMFVVGHDMRPGRWQAICGSRTFNPIEPSLIIARHPHTGRPETLPYRDSQHIALHNGDILSSSGCDLLGPLPGATPAADTP